MRMQMCARAHGRVTPFPFLLRKPPSPSAPREGEQSFIYTKIIHGSRSIIFLYVIAEQTCKQVVKIPCGDLRDEAKRSAVEVFGSGANENQAACGAGISQGLLLSEKQTD